MPTFRTDLIHNSQSCFIATYNVQELESDYIKSLKSRMCDQVTSFQIGDKLVNVNIII